MVKLGDNICLQCEEKIPQLTAESFTSDFMSKSQTHCCYLRSFVGSVLANYLYGIRLSFVSYHVISLMFLENQNLGPSYHLLSKLAKVFIISVSH